MGELPIGTVILLFTDRVGSTKLWEQQPAAMDARPCSRTPPMRWRLHSPHSARSARNRGRPQARCMFEWRCTLGSSSGAPTITLARR
ncbi:MAG: hypothetical protein ACJ8CR_37685 [Roseiflexaceae bacterium]